MPLVVSKAQYLINALGYKMPNLKLSSLTHTTPNPPLPIISPRVHSKGAGQSSSAATTSAADDDESSNAGAIDSVSGLKGEGCDRVNDADIWL